MVMFGAPPIHYSINRSGQRHTIAVTVNPNGSVSVTAPKGTRRSVIAEKVQSKAQWVLHQQERFRQHQSGYPREYVSGESFFYLGRQYKLKVHKTQKEQTEAHVHISNGLFRVGIPAQTCEEERQDIIRQQLVA